MASKRLEATSWPRDRRPLDAIDAQVLRLLAQNARASIRSVARELGMSPGAIAGRVDRLERRGVIRGYHAQTNPATLGYGTLAVVGLQIQHGAQLSESLDYLMTKPEVEAIYAVTGALDLLVIVHAKHQEHLRDLLVQELWRAPNFRHSETMVCLEARTRTGGWLPPLGE